MSDNGNLREKQHWSRSGPRVNSLREITVSYEGRDEQIVVKPPNLSTSGMFINTGRTFPQGAVLSLRFSLLLTGVEIETRCEVRHCQRGVGVGVEFIGLTAGDLKMIEREIELSTRKRKQGRVIRPGRRLKKAASSVRRKRRA
jgi:hypothetical protein